MRSGRIVIITGAAGAIGELFVRRFLENGDTVIAADNADGALKKFDGIENIRNVIVDIAEEESCAELASVARDNFGRVDVLINCAGFAIPKPFEEVTLADWNKVIGTNLTGLFLVVKAVLPLMKGRNWGRIISIGSGSMYEGVPHVASYIASKAGEVGLTRALARLVGNDGITVNVVTPGLTRTAAAAKIMPPEIFAAHAKARSIQRDERGEDIVGTVFFLASPDADFMSGQTLNIDGGKHFL